jgi:protocatechuate 3,4-dioxygenase beta subunit
MMKQKLLALLMVSVMVASTFGAMGISATKVGAAGETLTLSSTSYSPTVGEPFTLSGRLTDSSGNPLVNKSIDIFLAGAWGGS